MAALPSIKSYHTDDPSQAVSLALGEEGFALEEPTTVSRLLQKAVSMFPTSPALKFKENSVWKEWTYSQYYDHCVKVAKACIHVGLQPLHSVVITGQNAPEWLFSAVGALLAGGILAGIFPDAVTKETLEFLKKNFEADLLITEQTTFQTLMKVPGFNPAMFKAVILYGKEIKFIAGNIYTWEEFICCGEGIKQAVVEERIEAQLPGHCAYFSFTSGTTGGPKCVMTSHDNMTWRVRSFCKTVGLNTSGMDRCLLYRYMDAIAVHEFEVCIPWCIGGAVQLAEHDSFKNGTLIKTLQEVQPTYFFGPPRVWERFMEESENVEIQHVRKHLGFDQCNLPMCACAPVSKEILLFFKKCGIEIIELYGMTECGISVTNSREFSKLGSVGYPIAGTEMKINSTIKDTGEVLIRGRNAMMGYLANELKTAEVLDESGWLHTGDIGRIDEEGYLYITGRTSELIAIGTGLKIHPVPIENEIKKKLPFIKNVVVVGEGRKFLSCLVTLKVNYKKYNADRQVIAGVVTDNDVLDGENVFTKVQHGIACVNKGKSPPFKVMKFAILSKDFSVSGGELGPTLKLKRHFIMNKYSTLISTLCSDDHVNEACI